MCVNLASFASFLFSTTTMSAPTKLNAATNEVPIPKFNVSDEEAIMDIEALQCEAQAALEAKLVMIKAKKFRDCAQVEGKGGSTGGGTETSQGGLQGAKGRR